MAELLITVGSWAVIHDWRYRVVQITAVTAKQVRYTGSTFSSRCDRRKIIFVGTNEAATRLCQQLESSAAQYAEEQRNAILRRQKRDEEFIAGASKPVTEAV